MRARHRSLHGEFLEGFLHERGVDEGAESVLLTSRRFPSRCQHVERPFRRPRLVVYGFNRPFRALVFARDGPPAVFARLHQLGAPLRRIGVNLKPFHVRRRRRQPVSKRPCGDHSRPGILLRCVQLAQIVHPEPLQLVHPVDLVDQSLPGIVPCFSRLRELFPQTLLAPPRTGNLPRQRVDELLGDVIADGVDPFGGRRGPGRLPRARRRRGRLPGARRRRGHARGTVRVPRLGAAVQPLGTRSRFERVRTAMVPPHGRGEERGNAPRIRTAV